ncbi:MAG: hypothetical protein TREMPRED_003808 [Tremellales sp. Tagirdzhanova-0007]|nr:MAG: hypothetical protein TREMPRED_003808 [Tremellales sp. Tagirdzhanova-0007]
MHCGARAGQNHKVVVLEAVIERSAGSTLSHPNIVSLVTVKYLTPFTTSISTPITSAARLYKLSTGGVYLKDGNNPDFCLLLTAQHDVASSDQDTVQPAPHQNLGADVSFYDDSSFTRHLETIQGGVTTYESTVELFGRQMRQKTGAALQTATEALEGFKRDLETLKELREKLQEDWADPSQRVLGQVYCHSPLDYSAGEPRYTEDSALVAADGLKLDDREPSENLVNYQEWASRSSKQSHRDRFDPPLGTLYGSPFLFYFRSGGLLDYKERSIAVPVTVSFLANARQIAVAITGLIVDRCLPKVDTVILCCNRFLAAAASFACFIFFSCSLANIFSEMTEVQRFHAATAMSRVILLRLSTRMEPRGLREDVDSVDIQE